MARKAKFDYDIIVLGSGAAGSTSAIASAKAGKRVALVESGTFGGESPNWGDVPMRALLHTSHLYSEAKNASRFGLRSGTLGYNFPAVLSWRDKAVKRTGAASNHAYYQKNGIDTIHARAHFISPHEITVNRRHLSAEQFVIATGAEFAEPDVYGIESIRYKTPKTIHELSRIPRSMMIVGAGTEAVEYAQIFAALGTKVYIVEKSARLLPSEDSEVGELLETHFDKHFGITTLTHSQLLQVERRGLGVRVTYSRGGTHKTIQVDEMLFVMGRTPSTDLGLENAAVTYTPAGIDVNDRLQTSAKHIFAAGNVLSGDCSTQVAQLQGQVVAHNLLSKPTQVADTTLVPRVTATLPSIASVGLSENDCIRRDLATTTAIAPLTLVAKSNVSDNAIGFVKLIGDSKGSLLGATIVSPTADDMIAELTLALQHGLTAHDIATTPHAFLSWSESIRVAAQKLIP